MPATQGHRYTDYSFAGGRRRGPAAHPEVPLVLLLGLMHLGIYVSLFILGRACSRDDGGIDLINSASRSTSHSRRYLVENRLDPWPITACLKGLWLTDPPRPPPATSQSLAALIAGISTAFTPEERFWRPIGNLLLQFL